jgi:exosortase A-associated hydrolase 1
MSVHLRPFAIRSSRAGLKADKFGIARHLRTHVHPVHLPNSLTVRATPGKCTGLKDTPQIKAAFTALKRARLGVQRMVLWGMCDGASASLIYLEATQDTRVAGLTLLNSWVRSEAGLARAQVKHYYRQRLLEPAFWRKLFTGSVGWQALRLFGSTLRTMQSRPTQATATTFHERMAQAWREFPGPILLLLSERDLTAKEFIETAATDPAWHGWDRRPLLQQQVLPLANHTCSTLAAGQLVQDSVLRYLSLTVEKF